MHQHAFITTLLPLALRAGEAFRINPVVILAQAAIESGWGQSTLATEHHNFFGITAYGKPNAWWQGASVELGEHSLKFRAYPSPLHSLMDYGRLLRGTYPRAADLSHRPEAFAAEIAYSPYISEVNGDNRTAYKKLLVRVCKIIESSGIF